MDVKTVQETRIIYLPSLAGNACMKYLKGCLPVLIYIYVYREIRSFLQAGYDRESPFQLPVPNCPHPLPSFSIEFGSDKEL